MIVKNDKGEDQEVFTPEEVAAKVQAEVAAKDSALAAAMAEKTRLEGELSKSGGGNNPNFATLKAALDKKDQEINDLRTGIEDISKSRNQDIESGELTRLSGGNEELSKKIKHHFDTTLKAVQAKTKEEIAAKMENAAKLARDNATVDMVGNANYGAAAGGYSRPAGADGKVELTVGQKALASKMGITADDLKKYGGK